MKKLLFALVIISILTGCKTEKEENKMDLYLSLIRIGASLMLAFLTFFVLKNTRFSTFKIL
tara:strand:+ start:77 stop:259 length:183 start_codon:yes stop_codon:yes gene_type:complete